EAADELRARVPEVGGGVATRPSFGGPERGLPDVEHVVGSRRAVPRAIAFGAAGRGRDVDRGPGGGRDPGGNRGVTACAAARRREDRDREARACAAPDGVANSGGISPTRLS